MCSTFTDAITFYVAYLSKDPTKDLKDNSGAHFTAHFELSSREFLFHSNNKWRECSSTSNTQSYAQIIIQQSAKKEERKKMNERLKFM